METNKPMGFLMTGAVGHFLLCAAAALASLSGVAAAASSGMRGSGGGSGAAGGVMLAAILWIGGGITASFGYFGLQRLYRGTNALAGVLAIVMGLIPILLVIFIMGEALGHARRGGAPDLGYLAVILGVIPGLFGIFAGLGLFRARGGRAKVGAGFLVLGGLAWLLLSFLFPMTGSAATAEMQQLMVVAIWVALLGMAAGFFFAAMAMLTVRRSAD